MDGYFRLALAVIEQAIVDVQHGPPTRSAQARHDIANGGLDDWVDQVSIEPGSHGRLKRLLRDLLERG